MISPEYDQMLMVWLRETGRGIDMLYDDKSEREFLIEVYDGKYSVSPHQRELVDQTIADIREHEKQIVTRFPSEHDRRAKMIVNGREISAHFLKK